MGHHQNHVIFVKPFLRKDSWVLDVDCGTGRIISDIAKICDKGRSIGVDVDELVIHIAKAKYQTQSNLIFICFDLYRLPNKLNICFDLILISNILQHLKDPLKAIKTLSKLIKPSGFIAMKEDDWGSFVIGPENEYLNLALILRQKLWKANGDDSLLGRNLKSLTYEAKLEPVDISSQYLFFQNKKDIYRIADQLIKFYSNKNNTDALQSYALVIQYTLTKVITTLKDWKFSNKAIFTHASIQCIATNPKDVLL